MALWSRRRALVLVAVGIVAVLALLAALTAQGGSVVPWLLVTVGPWIVGDAVRRRRRLVVALRERKRELEAEQREHARLAVARERGRIAHELHDIVAHHLAVVVVLAGAGRLAPDDADANAERLAEIRRSAVLALEELDRLVELLQDRGEAPPRPLDVLLEQARAAGLPLQASPLPPGTVLPGPVEDCAYRIVQEGLTNALKHAPGSEVRVHLAAQGDALEIEVADDGARGPASELALTGAGLGLAGMRERVAALGGRLDAGITSGGEGWCVRARIPLARD
jgi:signal transduction histidine kinase